MFAISSVIPEATLSQRTGQALESDTLQYVAVAPVPVPAYWASVRERPIFNLPSVVGLASQRTGQALESDLDCLLICLGSSGPSVLGKR